MHIILQKQQEIQQLKNKLFELERLQAAERSAQLMANKLICTLRQQNTQLHSSIYRFQNQQSQISELLALKEHIDSLKRKNIELEQTGSNLRSEIFNTRSQMISANHNLDRTTWRNDMDTSMSNSELRSSSISSFVAPSLVDSRYTCTQVEQEDESAEPKPEYGNYLHPHNWRAGYGGL